MFLYKIREDICWYAERKILNPEIDKRELDNDVIIVIINQNICEIKYPVISNKIKQRLPKFL